MPLLIRRDGKLAGFALVNAVTHSGRAADRNMAEFFIVRKHRRSGIGRAAAQKIFSRYAGPLGGRRRPPQRRGAGLLARRHRQPSRVHDVEEFDQATAEWDGPIMRFRIALSA